MKKMTASVLALLIAGSAYTVHAEEPKTKTLSEAFFQGELPPIDTKTNEPIQMTAKPTVVYEYVVVKDDTLEKIAKEFDLDVATLKKWNNLIDDFLEIGQVLSVNGQVEPTPEQIAAMEEAKKRAEEEAKRRAEEEAKAKEEQRKQNEASNVISFAKQFLGVPYVFGGTSPSGFDCSGYVSYVLINTGKLNGYYNAAGLYSISQKVDSPQIGDLVFFCGTYKPGISHVGIYMGNNQMINASGNKVQINNIYDSYWGNHFTGFGRIN